MYSKPLNLLAAVVVGTTGDPRNNFRALKLGRLIGVVAIALFALIGTASAYNITVQVAPSAYGPVTSIPFTLFPLGTSSPQDGYLNSNTVSSGGETISFASAGGNPVPTTSGLYVGNPAGFAYSPFGNTDDTDNYLAAGDNGGTVTMTFTTPQTTLDLLWGTVDYYNQNQLFTLSVGGLAIDGSAIYNAEVAQSVVPNYVNNGDSAFNVAVEITGLPSFTVAQAEDAFTSPAFEFVPGASVVSVPEPSGLALLGIALLESGVLFRFGRRGRRRLERA